MAPFDVNVQVVGGGNYTVPFSSIDVIAFAEDENILCRPCVDCGLRSGCFCDFCKAKDRLPNEVWADNQYTPLCTRCDRMHDAFHFCRNQRWCAPPPHNHRTDTEHTRAGDENLQQQQPQQ